MFVAIVYVGDCPHGPSVRWYPFRCIRCAEPFRLRPRSVRLLRPSSQPRRLVRHVRPHRVLLPRRQLALCQWQLPLAFASLVVIVGWHRLASWRRQYCNLRPRANIRAIGTAANSADCNDFSQRRGEPASMYSRPFGLRRCASCASLQGGPSRARRSRLIRLRSTVAVLDQSLKGGSYASWPEGCFVRVRARTGAVLQFIELRRGALRVPGHRLEAMRMWQSKLLRRLRTQSLDRRRLRLRGQLWLRIWLF
jgi:hypothetical protein